MAVFDNAQVEQQQELQTQQQRLSAQQMLVVNLLQLSTQEMEDRVRTEILDNPALEEGSADERPIDDTADDSGDDDITDELEGDSMGTTADADTEFDDDNDNSSDYRTGSETTPREEIPIDAGISFFDLLKEQLGEQPLTDKQQAIGLFLVGSLDDDGWLRKSIHEIVEVLAFKADIDTTADEVEGVLHVIQQFDPAGVGARNLQECLLLQLNRNEIQRTECEDQQDNKPTSQQSSTARRILTECFDDFAAKRWDRIPDTLGISKEDTDAALTELTRLNPHPGSSLSEMVGKGMQQLVPDFVMDSEGDEAVPVLNNGGLPALRISSEFREMLAAQSKNGTPAQREAAKFLQQKIDSAQGFIQAVRQREQTLNAVMRAIVDIQKDFFQTGDEETLKPMILQDVETASGYDISTISRVSNTKYIQTRFGIFPLKYFFSNKRVKVGGEESETYINLNDVLKELKALVDGEDKSNPLTDDKLATLLNEKGFNVARRTVAKYREALSIPIAKMRRQ
ncbi:MAG: RNA polymerase factor sigma-54 [Bacteroidaceae bacterium]|nr:RNA polymerase factor sigma-54 [Bacteroidaceae bacterium]